MNIRKMVWQDGFRSTGERLLVPFVDLPPCTYFQHEGRLYFNVGDKLNALNLDTGMAIMFNPNKTVPVVPVKSIKVSEVEYGI